MKRVAILLIWIALFINSFSQDRIERDSLVAWLMNYMPQPDREDYSLEFWNKNVEVTLQARSEMPWGSIVPEREWRYFVLPIRVNNEHLDSARWVFYEQLRDRVKNLSMTEAALEVNHWCHEHVTYHPSDARTSSPLATIRTALGRCGEESTLTVAAMRSIGIPARQVYTPRWAHTDDNHAWVEVWTDGAWHFLGACEPEPVLDLGWFNAPASRGILMHTKVFGYYDGPEQVMRRTACFTEIDVTSNYAPTAMSRVRVVDRKGKAVQNAEVSFRIYNYAEFYPVSTKKTDADGRCSLTAGIGDLVVWACKDGLYGVAISTVGGDETELRLEYKMGSRTSIDFTINPPKECYNLPIVSEEQRSENNRRLANEDSLRCAYVTTFPQSDRLLCNSRGNWQTITTFRTMADDKNRVENLLGVLTEKDLRDITLEVLMDSYNHNKRSLEMPDGIYNNYVLNPRILTEYLIPYKSDLLKLIPNVLQTQWSIDADKIFEWVRDSIIVDNEHNPQRILMSPISSFRTRITDARSQQLLYVAIMRTMGWPARINSVTSQLERWNNGWKSVHLSKTKDEKIETKRNLLFAYDNSGSVDPKYYYNFTLSRIVNGAPLLLEFDEGETWRSAFSGGQNLEQGDYMLLSGTRLASGTVLAHAEIFPLKGKTTIPLHFNSPAEDEGLKVIGTLNSEALYANDLGDKQSILVTTGRGYYILAFIAPSNEPTIHLLQDISLVREQIDSWGGTLLLLTRTEDEMSRIDKTLLPPLPSNTSWGVDCTGEILAELQKEFNLTNATSMPILVIADTFNRVVFLNTGYTIGMGERLVKLLP